MEKTSDSLREKISHGNAMFPLMVHEINTNSAISERIGCHWHSEFEILVITEGEAQFRIDDRYFNVKKGGIVFIKSDSLHSMNAAPGTPADFYAVVFHPDFMGGYGNDSIQHKYIDSVNDGSVFFSDYIFPKEEWEHTVFDRLALIKELFAQKQPGYELLIKSYIYEIWYLMYTHCAKNINYASKQSDHKITRIKSMLLWLRNNYREHITITAMAVQFHISEGQLCRFFKSMTKMSIIEYINYYRISKSIELLESTDMPVGEIALESGFDNISYYNKVFKKYMYMTPVEFRMSSREQGTKTEIITV